MDIFQWLVAFTLLLILGGVTTQVDAAEVQTAPDAVELTVDIFIWSLEFDTNLSTDYIYACTIITPQGSPCNIFSF